MFVDIFMFLLPWHSLAMKISFDNILQSLKYFPTKMIYVFYYYYLSFVFTLVKEIEKLKVDKIFCPGNKRQIRFQFKKKSVLAIFLQGWLQWTQD